MINARLSIQKQAEIVHCLSQLSNVLGMSLQRGSSPNMSSMPKDNIGTDNYKERTEDHGLHTSCDGATDLLQQGGTNPGTTENCPDDTQRHAGEDHRDGVELGNLPRHNLGENN